MYHVNVKIEVTEGPGPDLPTMGEKPAGNRHMTRKVEIAQTGERNLESLVKTVMTDAMLQILSRGTQEQLKEKPWLKE